MGRNTAGRPYSPYWDRRKPDVVIDVNVVEQSDRERLVAQSVKARIINKATQWLAVHAPEYSEYDPIEDEYNFRFTDMFIDFKKAMEDVKV